MPYLVRFGHFALDLETGDLHRNGGERIRLPEQQLQILEVLLNREGGVVSRDEIRKRLWPNDTIVEFDRSINAAIMKLRSTLGDTADKPQFIETIARRGYRIVVPVEINTPDVRRSRQRETRGGSLVGREVSHYRVLSVLGAGGMGLVYKAEDLRLKRLVALKFISREMAGDPRSRRRFEREARTASSLNHPNICTIYQVAEHESQPFIVMELLEGQTLSDLIISHTASSKGANMRADLPRLLLIAIQVAEGLDAAHRKNVIHRDIKPANIFVTTDGPAKILDFGVARTAVPSGRLTLAGSAGARDGDTADGRAALASVRVKSRRKSSGGTANTTLSVTGTTGYMSPEQIRGKELSSSSDLFSLGVLLYEMTTGVQPFVAPTTDALFEAILHLQPASPRSLSPAIPAALERLILKLMEKSPERRFAHASDVAVELRAVREQYQLVQTNSPSIAVLPFEDLSPDRSQQAFCEGMAAEIINALGGVPGLRVISRTSAVLCREKKMELSQIGEHLGVSSVLEGTVRKSGSRLRVTAHLINTGDGSQTWSHRYDRDEGDLFEIQDEIAAAIVGTLRGHLVSPAPVRRSTGNLEAYKLYLKGRYFWERRNRAYLQRAMIHFDQAIAADPDFALPHSGLADCFLILAVYSIKPFGETYPKALALARRALELDPDLAEGHHSLGAIRMMLERDWAGAEASLSRALELDPRLIVARGYRALLFAVTNRWELALSEAALIVPAEPDSGLICYLAAATQFCAGNSTTALPLIERALELEPHAIMIHWIGSWIYALQGRPEDAITEGLHAAIASDHHQMLVAGLGVAYARAGRTGEAIELIAELKERASREFIASQWIGEIYLALNRHSEALDYFERAFEERNSFLLALGSAPQYRPLRGEPRYHSLLERLRLG